LDAIYFKKISSHIYNYIDLIILSRVHYSNLYVMILRYDDLIILIFFNFMVFVIIQLIVISDEEVTMITC